MTARAVTWPTVAAAATGIQVGSAMVATRFVVEQSGPASLALLRYAIGFCCLLPFVVLAVPRTRFAPRDLKRNRVYLDDSACTELFRRLFSGRSVLFSACLVGKHASDIETFRRAAHLKYVAAFCREIMDDDAILFDLALYHATINLGLTFPVAVKRAREALDKLAIRGGRGKEQKLVRVFG